VFEVGIETEYISAVPIFACYT